MRAAADFQFVMRRGHKSGRATVVVYYAQTGEPSGLAGFAVSQAVGGAVIRNKVKRRLRAIVSDVMPQLPPQSSLVIRALPASASASFERLRDDVTSALESAMAKAVA